MAVKLGDALGFPDMYLPTGRILEHHPWLAQADVINAHNLHGHYFPLPMLAQISQKKPVIWTLHDMWSFTGHCGYSFTCQGWRHGCGKCPALDTPPSIRRDTTRSLWRRRQRVYAQSNLRLVTPSRWLASLAMQSPLLSRFPVQVIPNGVNVDVFKPQPRVVLNWRMIEKAAIFYMLL